MHFIQSRRMIKKQISQLSRLKHNCITFLIFPKKLIKLSSMWLQRFNYIDLQISELKLIKLMQQNNSANFSQAELQNDHNLTKSRSMPKKTNKVHFTSMLKGDQELKKKEVYFHSLLTKHPLKLEHVNLFFSNKTEQFATDILEGKYDIKPFIWSPEQQQNRLAGKKKSTEALLLKKNLQNELKNIENQLTEQQNLKTSRVISEQQHINFMKKIQNEKKQLLKKKQQAAKLQEEQKLQEERRLKEQKQKIELQKKNKKRKQIQETLRILEEQQKKRLEISKQQELILKQKMKEKTMVDKIEEQYNLKQNQSLEEKKKRLAQIRTLHRPINKQQLDEFAAKFDNLQKQKLAARSSSVQQTLNKSSQIFYKSAFYKKIQKEKKLFEDSKNEQQINKLKEARDKLKKFSEHVKTTYKPTIDEKLVEEMKFRSANLTKRGHSTSHSITETPQKIGLRYLEFSKLQVDHQKLLVSGQQQEPQQQKQTKLDYLVELRKKNKRKEIKSAQDLLQQIEKQNLSKQKKQQKILQFTEKLEKKAKMKEQLQKMGKNHVDSQLDTFYLQAIEAKLMLLDDI